MVSDRSTFWTVYDNVFNTVRYKPIKALMRVDQGLKMRLSGIFKP